MIKSKQVSGEHYNISKSEWILLSSIQGTEELEIPKCYSHIIDCSNSELILTRYDIFVYIGSGICTPKLFITNSYVDKGIMRGKDQYLVQKRSTSMH